MSDGDVAASLSGYPELDDDESFGVDDDGNFVVQPAGDATPGDGPIVAGGCDFEISSANAIAAADTGDTDDNTETNDRDGAAEDDTASGSNGGDDSLATTGTRADAQALFAQTLIFVGFTMVVAARISLRRSRDYQLVH